MRKVVLEDLKPGMKLYQPVFSADGTILIPGGTVLNSIQIALLDKAGLPGVFIGTDNPSETYNIISESNSSILLQLLYALEKEVREGKMSFMPFKEPLFAIVDEVMRMANRLISPPAIRIHEAYIYGHAVNVTILSLLIGRTFRYELMKMRELAVCAMFHDMGMYLVPREILQKKGPLNQMEQRKMEEHTMLGFQFIQEFQDIPRSVPSIVYQHHERLDGSGYPRSLTGRNILEMSRIVGVADVYDAMTSERVYRNAFRPSQVVGYLKKNSGFLFDSSVVDALLKNVATYPEGSRVRLSNGHKAMVVSVNIQNGDRPIVQDIDSEKIIDLLAHPDISVTEELSMENMGLLKIS